MVNAIKQPSARGTIRRQTCDAHISLLVSRRRNVIRPAEGSPATAGSTAFTHDKPTLVGSVETDYLLEWDQDNRLKKATVENDDVEYRYDALGRRVIRKEGTNETALIWWGDSENAEYEHSAGQACIQNDIFAHPSALNTVIARAIDGDENDLEWYHKNYLDHVYAVSDDTGGDLIEHYRYSAFGEIEVFDELGVRIAATGIANTITWNTRRLDGLTGFYLYKYRHYSPQLGRWPSRDPIEERGGYNLYGYVGNDGVNQWDMLGQAIGAPDYDIGNIKFKPGDPDMRPRKKVGESYEAAHVSVGWYVHPKQLPPKEQDGKTVHCVEIEAQLRLESAVYWIDLDTIDPIKNPGNVNIIGHKRNYTTVREHELRHLTIYSNWWIEMAGRLNPYEGCYCSRKCAGLAENVIRAGKNLFYGRAKLDNGYFDQYSYGGGQDAMEEGHGLIDTWKPKFDKALKAFNDEDCAPVFAHD